MIGPILFVLYTADAENNRCTWTTPLLLHKRYTALLLHFRVNGVQPTQAQSLQILSFYWCTTLGCRRLLDYST